MSDATERPYTDAWAQACAEDLAAEQARRRARCGTPPDSAAEELRKLVDAVAEKVSAKFSPLQSPIVGATAQEAVRQLITQAKAAVEPVIERNSEVFDHLAAAGAELLAACRAASEARERHRSADAAPSHSDDGPSDAEHIDRD